MPRVLNPPSDAPPRTPRGRRLRSFTPLVPVALIVAAAALAQPAPQRPTSLTTRVWRFDDGPRGPLSATVMTPSAMRPGERLPLLIALHGWGESARGPDRGAWGWPRDYELGASDAALRRAPLAREAFLGFVDDARLHALRSDLAARPYAGLLVVAPYTPDVLDDPELAAAFGRWVVSTLVPRARRELPVIPTREATGVDGVSLGGLLALETGLAHPQTFGAVGALQAAVRGRVARVLARRSASRAPAPQRIRLVTSRRDHLRPDVLALHRAMDAAGLAHELRVVAGPHDYVFNRGAGGIEMLLFHDRALRGLSAP